ncbi:hypothetical protein AWH48_11535 [Domibacillus aminovorans]|uniref:Uncharacterized protein n=1 Tax=Domibacillus aminovorans TaxID=29332 RepID=A0A177KKK7_9BACI|nr:hypothetical protein [Domibacillus aminovorans]OAH53893.1 hypothetical protein AWH48_11535 [Domibacillus aminovorans]
MARSRRTIRSLSELDAMADNLAALNNKKIKVGVFGADSAEMVMIATVHEYGTEITVTDKMRGWFAYQGYPLKKETTKIVIPERSFLRSGFDENIDDITDKMKRMMTDVIDGNIDQDVFFNAIGLEFAGLIQKKLRDLRDPADSSMTTVRKGSSNPLIDSGRLVGSIRHEVE